MKKTTYAIVITLILCLFLPVFVFNTTVEAINEKPRFIDEAELLTQQQAIALQNKLNEISQRQQFDVLIVSVNSLEGKTGEAYADDFFDYNEYGMGAGDSGIILLISMEYNDIVMSTKGFGITAFTDAGQDYMWDEFLPDVSDGNYFMGFSRYAELCDDFLTQAKTSKPYDTRNMPNKPGFLRSFVNLLPISFIVGVVLTFIVTGIMKMKLKSVRMQAAAGSYIRQGSVNITYSSDNFLYSTVKKTAKQTSSSGGSSTHRSSSGSTHGGSSRKF